MLCKIAQIVGSLDERLPLVVFKIKAHQDALIMAVTYLEECLIDNMCHRRTAVMCFIVFSIRFSPVDPLTHLHVSHLKKSVFIEEQQVLLLPNLQVLQVHVTAHGPVLLGFYIKETLFCQQPHNVCTVYKEVGHVCVTAKLPEHILNRIDESLCNQVHAGHAVCVLQPKMSATIKINMVIPTILR